MVARITTVAFNGIEVLDVDVQVQISGGMPVFTVVGLPDILPQLDPAEALEVSMIPCLSA